MAPRKSNPGDGYEQRDEDRVRSMWLAIYGPLGEPSAGMLYKINRIWRWQTLIWGGCLVLLGGLVTETIHLIPIWLTGPHTP